MFARVAGIPVETLLDDKLNLPENNRYRVIKHKDE